MLFIPARIVSHASQMSETLYRDVTSDTKRVAGTEPEPEDFAR